MSKLTANFLLAWITLCTPLLAQSNGLMSFEEAKQRADRGDAFAQAVVALHYQLGWNTEKNPELAAKYALASANAGEPLGQFRLGALLRAGEGIPKDEQQGLNLQAASFNSLYAAQNPYSMTAAGVMIFQGKAIGQNISQDERRRDAAVLYKKAADAGYAPAQFNYAMCANAGHGIEKSLKEHEEYLMRAIANQYPPALNFASDGAAVRDPVLVLGEEDGAKTSTHPQRLETDRPNSFITGTHRDREWVYGFVENGGGIAQQKLTSLKKPGTPVFSDDEWIVTNTLRPDGTGFASSLLRFYDARSLLLKHTVTVPNDVFHLDRSATRNQWLLVTACGYGNSSSCLPHDVDQALVLLDVGKHVVERIQLWKEDEYHLQWNGECAPRWKGNTIEIPPPTNPDRLPHPSAKASRKEFSDVSLIFLGNRNGLESVPSSKSIDSLSLKLAGLTTSTNNSSVEHAGLAASQSVVGTVKNGQMKYRVFARFDSGTLQKINFSNLQANSHRSTAGVLDGLGLLDCGTVWLLSDDNLHFVSDVSEQAVNLLSAMSAPENQLDQTAKAYAPRAIFPDVRTSNMREDNMQVDASGNTVQVARFNDAGVSITSFTKEGKASREKVQMSELARHGPTAQQFAFDARRRTLSFVYGAFGYWAEEDWTSGELKSPLYSNVNPHGILAHYRFFGEAPEGWSVTSSITAQSKWGARDSLVELTDLESQKNYVVSQGPHRHTRPLVCEVDRPRGLALVISSGETAARVESVNLATGDVSLVDGWRWDPELGIALYEPSGRWLLIPSQAGYAIHKVEADKPMKRLAELVVAGADQYAIVLPNGSYAGSPGCESVLSLKAGDGEVDGSSIATWRNRPPEVLKALGGDPEQIEVLAKVTERWHKRIGFDASKPEPKASDLPRVSVPERPPLWAESDEVQFPIEWQAGASPVRRVTVRVNGVESSRFQGDVLPDAKASKGSVEAKVKLAKGQNWIEVTVEDSEGRRSDLQRFRTILKDSPTDTKRYIIALGVSDYAKPELNLQFAAKDANDLLVALAGEGAVGGGILSKLFGGSDGVKGSDHVLLLTDSQVDQAVVDKIREFVSKASESDEVILFCAGHGVLDDKLDYYLAGHDFDPNRPAETGIKLDELVDAVSSAKALRRLILLDTCHSGVVGEKDEMLLAQLDTKLPTGVRAVAQRGMKVQQAADFSASDKQRFIEEMFSLPGTTRGVNIIGASAGAQFALESDKWNNGVFTASVIEGIRDKKADWNQDGRIMVSELKNYLGQRVSELTAGAQKPSVVAFEQDQDFDLLN
jgi:hypothetical protein